jgi:hypothetical protein
MSKCEGQPQIISPYTSTFMEQSNSETDSRWASQEVEGALLCSQEPATGTYFASDESILHPSSLRSMLM